MIGILGEYIFSYMNPIPNWKDDPDKLIKYSSSKWAQFEDKPRAGFAGGMAKLKNCGFRSSGNIYYD